MITPTIGRVVWFQPSKQANEPELEQPLAGIVTYVHTDRCVNLAVFNASGTAAGASSVPLMQDGDERPAHGYFAEWMPYQKGQAAKTEAAEKQLANVGTQASA